jgi:type IV pilus assembly protein PilA
MKNLQQGFTLIELMTVVAIIAILAAIAISQYQDYVIRAQVSEGSVLADGTKTAMAEYFQTQGKFPSANISAGLASATSIKGQYVSAINVGSVPGQIRASYNGTNSNAKIKAMILVFSAVTNAGSIEWHCKSDTLQQKWCSSSCKCQ